MTKSRSPLRATAALVAALPAVAATWAGCGYPEEWRFAGGGDAAGAGADPGSCPGDCDPTPGCAGDCAAGADREPGADVATVSGCDAASCAAGCCRAGDCRVPAVEACGLAGGACLDCRALFGDRVDACGIAAQCVCTAAGGVCPAGQRCTAAGCVEACEPNCGPSCVAGGASGCLSGADCCDAASGAVCDEGVCCLGAGATGCATAAPCCGNAECLGTAPGGQCWVPIGAAPTTGCEPSTTYEACEPAAESCDGTCCMGMGSSCGRDADCCGDLFCGSGGACTCGGAPGDSCSGDADCCHVCGADDRCCIPSGRSVCLQDADCCAGLRCLYTPFGNLCVE